MLLPAFLEDASSVEIFLGKFLRFHLEILVKAEVFAEGNSFLVSFILLFSVLSIPSRQLLIDIEV